MTAKTPTCTAKGGKLTIAITQDLTSKDYSTFKFKFEIAVTMPKDTILTGTTVSATIEDPNSNMVHATSNSLSGFLAPSRPSG